MPLQSHFVLSCKANWSHLRSLCVLATKIVSIRPITITILVSNVPNLIEKVTKEIKRCLEQEEHALASIRIVALGHGSIKSTNEGHNRESRSELDYLRDVWSQLIGEQPVRCAHSGALYPAEQRPSLFMLDGLQRPWVTIVKSLQFCPPVVQWMAGFSGGFLRITGPEDMGGRGDFLRNMIPDAIETLGNVPLESKGKVIRIPGMPTMYDWEYVPQQLGPQSHRIFLAEVMLANVIDEVDGLATSCAIDYDGEVCLDAISTWISRLRDRPTFHVGPMLPLNPGTCDFSKASLQAESSMAPEGVGAKVSGFLDKMLDKYGKDSTFYISFGTEHWPSSLDHLRVLLLALKNKRIPFLLAHAYPQAVVPEDIKKEFEDSDAALFTRFVPQQVVLAHKACGWFLTHGGSNGTIEAASQGVPMIGWPFAIDHPLNIAHVVRQLDLGFEFVEVRNGELGLKKLYKTGDTPQGTLKAFGQEVDRVLTAAFGDEGERKRNNARQIRAKLATAWTREGKARKTLEQLVDHYTGENIC